MNFIIFSLLCINKNPIILVPGAFRTRLAVSVTTQEKCPKCPQNKTYFPFWISFKMIFTKVSCLINWLTLDYDENQKKIVDQPNVTIIPMDFGGVEGIRGTGNRIFGKNQPTYYDKIIKKLEKRNYTVGETIFGAPYDWRRGVSQTEEFWTNFTQLVETAFNKTNRKVKFLTHSFGGCIVHKFLTEITSSEWRQKYIHSAVLSAPSFSGSGEALVSLYRQRIPFIKFLKNDRLKEMVGSLGGFHVHIPNSVIFANTTVFITPEGENINGSKVIDFLHEHQKLNDKQLKIAEQNIQYVSKFPESFDVPVRIHYNSAIDTVFGLKLKNWKSEGKEIRRKGDGLVMSEGIEVLCKKWKSEGRDVQCVDINSSSLFARHPLLVLRDKYINKLLDWLVEQPDSSDLTSKEL